MPRADITSSTAPEAGRLFGGGVPTPGCFDKCVSRLVLGDFGLRKWLICNGLEEAAFCTFAPRVLKIKEILIRVLGRYEVELDCATARGPNADAVAE